MWMQYKLTVQVIRNNKPAYVLPQICFARKKSIQTEYQLFLSIKSSVLIQELEWVLIWKY